MAESESLLLTVLGSRGSMPTCGPETATYGGDTSCYLLQAGEERLILDAGTGLAAAQLSGDGPIHILLTHTHLDHILGLPLFRCLGQRGRTIHLYCKTRGGLDTAAQLSRLFSPPLWPATLQQYPARVVCHELTLPLQIGAFAVDGMESAHPGGSTVLRVRARGKSLVYATDFAPDAQKNEELIALAQGCDLLLYDAQYPLKEYEQKRAYGHSTTEEGLRVAARCHAKRLLLIHHDPAQTDDCLQRREAALGVRFAKQGEVISL